MQFITFIPAKKKTMQRRREKKKLCFCHGAFVLSVKAVFHSLMLATSREFRAGTDTTTPILYLTFQKYARALTIILKIFYRAYSLPYVNCTRIQVFLCIKYTKNAESV